jgi:alkylated DNA repair protein alkB family protein 6
MYTDHLHGIQNITADEDLNETTVANWTLLGDKEAFSIGRYERQTRTSLTYRDVIKVSNVGKLFGGRK